MSVLDCVIEESVCEKERQRSSLELAACRSDGIVPELIQPLKRGSRIWRRCQSAESAAAVAVISASSRSIPSDVYARQTAS